MLLLYSVGWIKITPLIIVSLYVGSLMVTTFIQVWQNIWQGPLETKTYEGVREVEIQ